MPSDEANKLSSLLDELRILLQGSQVLTSFLIILPFNASFDALSGGERLVYTATFLCSLTSLVLFSAPALHHYLRRPVRHVEQFKANAGRFAWAGALFMSVALTLSTRLVAARVLGDPWTWLVPAAVGALLLVAWWWVPLAHEARTYGGPDDA